MQMDMVSMKRQRERDQKTIADFIHNKTESDEENFKTERYQ